MAAPKSILAGLLDNPNFAKWFGKSRVTETPWASTPKEVYHGSSSSGFDFFDTESGKFGLFGDGAYFTESPEIASQYAAKKGGQFPGVVPGYLKVENPMQMEGYADHQWRSAFPDASPHFDKSATATNEDRFKQLVEYFSQEGIPTYEAGPIFRDGVRSMGYDGLTHFGGGRHAKSDGTKHRVWIAFEPEQFKSRFNSGSFDPNNPNFLKSAAPLLAGGGLLASMFSPQESQAASIGVSPGSLARMQTAHLQRGADAVDSEPVLDPVGMFIGAATGGAGFAPRAAGAALDPAFNYVLNKDSILGRLFGME